MEGRPGGRKSAGARSAGAGKGGGERTDQIASNRGGGGTGGGSPGGVVAAGAREKREPGRERPPREGSGRGAGFDARRAQRALDQVAEQMARSGPPSDLLKQLGWDAGRLKDFVDRYRRRLAKLNAAASLTRASGELKNKSERGEERSLRLKLERGAGLDESVRVDSASGGPAEKDEVRKLFQSARRSVALEYRDLVDAYFESLAGAEGEE